MNTAKKNGVGTVGMSVVEGLSEVTNEHLDWFKDFTMKSIDTSTNNGTEEGHLALKLTAFVSTNVMKKLSTAHERFAKEVLEVSYRAEDSSVLTQE